MWLLTKSVLSRTERKLLNVISFKINGVRFEIKRITPNLCLDKQGIPISNWEVETNRFVSQYTDKSLTLEELQKTWKRIFKLAIVSVDGSNECIDKIIDTIIQNITVSGELYNKIVCHSFMLKKNTLKILYQKTKL